MTLGQALALIGVGFVGGILNVIAGGGSFLTLPLMIFMGLPPSVANGTNRVAILVQNVGAVWGFSRHRVLDWRWARWAALPAAVGAVGGTWLALRIGDEAFRRTLAVLMVLVTLWSLVDPLARRKKPPPSGDRSPALPRPLLMAAGFLLVGIYGGFVQAGVGFLILAATTMGGLDLVRGNAVKVLAILCFTAVSLGIFAWEGKVRFGVGLVLAVGMLAGGLVGVRLTVLKGHAWVKGVVTVTLILFAVKLWVAP